MPCQKFGTTYTLANFTFEYQAFLLNGWG